MKPESPGKCSNCGSPLDAEFRNGGLVPVCRSEVCGYRSPPTGPVSAGRYRHPMNADGKPCLCNQGHVVGN